MYKGIITTPIAVTANTDIPFTTVFNTNQNTIAKEGVVSILKPGFWNAKAQINYTGVSGDLTVQFYNNGEPIPETSWTMPGNATADFFTATLIDAFKVIRSLGISLANISIRFSADGTISRGVFVVDEEK